MARRSKPNVTQFFNRDRLAFTALFKVGHVTNDHLHQCGLADSRIKNLVRDGQFEKVAYKRAGKIEECYKLTKQGRETATHQWGLERSYHAQSPVHDLAIADKYFGLPQELQENWKTESQIRDLFLVRLNTLREQGKEVEADLYKNMLDKGLLSMPDGLYVNERGTTIAFEAITNSYGYEELRSKQELMEFMNYKYEATRV